MKYKVLKGTGLFDKIMGVHKLMQDATDEAQKIVDTIPEADGFSKSSHGMAGGIGAFHFKDGTSTAMDGWKKMEKGWTHWFMLKSGDKRNKELISKIDSLPIVKHEVLNNLLNFSFTVTGFLEVWHCPIVHFKKNYILIETPDGSKYNPVSDMVEINGSEFYKLNKDVKQKRVTQRC